MSYQNRNKDEFILYLGRLATASGLICLAAASALALLLNLSTPALIFLPLLGGYIGLTGFWGVHKLRMKLRSYRSRFSNPLYKTLHFASIIPGAVLGTMLYGLFQQFILFLALDDGSGKPGFLASVIILTPKLGPWYARKINYSPRGKNHDSNRPR
ncbi:hypothetical protein [Halarsenatibacter silvermanii]|uniref:Uncharacterized protein n=1 Tax=Halarsenatibacter silvermanii TaxID=321763 RepID=A0A1G9NJR4_9FIRM|nr:hypothetical protein [Halarsenatibacter silvermanii]SDL86247.1 hypothetical protein SAMN04488692_11086 [Halarsenatibacter silvermanii]